MILEPASATTLPSDGRPPRAGDPNPGRGAVGPRDAAGDPAATGAASSVPWAQIASEAAATRDEVAAVLAAGLDAPGLLDGLGRTASTLRWVQERVEAGVAGPGDRTALGAVLAARRSIDEARCLVRDALASWTGTPADEGAVRG